VGLTAGEISGWESGGGGEHELASATSSSPAGAAAAAPARCCVVVLVCGGGRPETWSTESRGERDVFPLGFKALMGYGAVGKSLWSLNQRFLSLFLFSFLFLFFFFIFISVLFLGFYFEHFLRL
jgi:hypothetical protein